MNTRPDSYRQRALAVAALLLLPGMGAASSTSLPAASRIGVAVDLDLAALQRRVRAEAAASPGIRPVSVTRTGAAGVGAAVRATPVAQALGVAADPHGTLTFTLPVDIVVTPVIPGLTGAAVRTEGCGPARYRLGLAFVPAVVQGRLRFGTGSVRATAPRGYRCLIATNALGDAIAGIGNLFGKGRIEGGPRVDVAGEIGAALTQTGRDLADPLVDRLNAVLPDTDRLQRLADRPVAFGDAIALGIEAPRFRFTGVGAGDGRYRLRGELEGLPQLRFGAAAVPADPIAAPAAGDLPGGEGFRLPATLLLPTDAALLPDPAAGQASGWLGDFRLRPVNGRQDLAVLQRRAEGGAENVVWLSGGDVRTGVDGVRFEQPMADVLQAILDWLDDPALWRGVDGIPELRREVSGFMRLLDGFQRETRLPLPGRGELSFRRLRLDLGRLWVTEEAILADVILHGTAELTLDVTL